MVPFNQRRYSGLPTMHFFSFIFLCVEAMFKGVSTQLLFRNPNFAFFFTILNMNMYPIITNINNSPSANFSCIIWEIKMTIFIIFSSQKTRGRVAGNLAWLHATQLRDRRIANGITRCILLRTFIYALLVSLGAVAQRKKR